MANENQDFSGLNPRPQEPQWQPPATTQPTNAPATNAPSPQSPPQSQAPGAPPQRPMTTDQPPVQSAPIVVAPAPPIVSHPVGGLKPIAAKQGVNLGAGTKTGPALHTPGVSRDQPRAVPIHAIEADPAPGEWKPEQPGLYTNANYHEQEHVPQVQTGSWQKRDISGNMMNVHGPCVVAVRQRAVNPDAEGGENWNVPDPNAPVNDPNAIDVSNAPTLPGPQAPQAQGANPQPQAPPANPPKPADNPTK